MLTRFCLISRLPDPRPRTRRRARLPQHPSANRVLQRRALSDLPHNMVQRRRADDRPQRARDLERAGRAAAGAAADWEHEPWGGPHCWCCAEKGGACVGELGRCGSWCAYGWEDACSLIGRVFCV